MRATQLRVELTRGDVVGTALERAHALDGSAPAAVSTITGMLRSQRRPGSPSRSRAHSSASPASTMSGRDRSAMSSACALHPASTTSKPSELRFRSR